MMVHQALAAFSIFSLLCAGIAEPHSDDRKQLKDALQNIVQIEQMPKEQSELQEVDDTSLAKTQSAIDTINKAFNDAIDKLRTKIGQAPCNYLRKQISKFEEDRGNFFEEGDVIELEPNEGQFIYLREIIPIRGLNIKLQYVKFDCSSNELTVDTVPSGKMTIIPHFMSLNGLKVSLTVTLTNPANTLQLDMNGNWKVGNLNIAVNLFYSRADGNTEVTATPKRGTSVKSFIKSITSLSLPINPSVNFDFKFVGYIGDDGFTTLTVTSDKGPNKFYAIYQKQDRNSPSAKGFAVDIKRLRLSTIIKKVVNLDISSVPFFGRLAVKELGLAYATNDIIGLEKDAFKNSQMLQRMDGQIDKGLTAYVAVPFHNDPMLITYQDQVLTLTTPKKDLRLDRLLKYLISGGGRWKLSLPKQISNIFRINIEEIAIDKETVTVDVSYPRRITFVKGLLALSKVKVSIIIAKTSPRVSADINGIIHLAGANFDTTISRNQRQKYVLTAKGDQLSINKLFNRLHAAILPKVISRFLSRIPFLNFKIIKPRITYVFGARPLQFEIGGTPVVQGFRVTNVDTLIVKTSTGTKVILGFELGTFSFAEVLRRITRFNFGRFPILNQKVTSTVMISPISSQRLRFSSGKLASLTVTRGVSLIASMRFPRNCRRDKFCKFAGRLIGHTAVLSLKATISSATYFPISATINNLRLGRGIVLGRAGIEIVGGASPRIGLVGEVHLRKPPLIFAARISVGTKGLSLELSVTNCWNRAFGARWLDICNLLGSIDFAPPTGITGLAFGGEIRLGYKSTGHQIIAKGYIGLSIINPFENYYYVKFSRITMGSLLKAFKIRWRLPRPLAQSGFPNGYLNSFSLAGKELPQVHVSIPVGYRMKGTLNILGLQGHADITIGLPKGIDIKVGLPAIRIGRILAMYASPRDRRRGPYLRVKLQVLPRFIVHIEAAGYLKVLGISLETRLKITNTQYEFFIRGKILHLFQASLHITARYGSIKRAHFRVRGEFKLDLFNGIKRFVKNLFRNIANVAKRAFDGARRLVKKFLGLWRKAKRAVSRAWRKVKRFARKIFGVQVMEYCSGRSCKKATIQWGRRIGRFVRRTVRRGGRFVRRTVRRGGRFVRRTVRRGGRFVRRTVRRGGRFVRRTVRRGARFVRRTIRRGVRYVRKGINWVKRKAKRLYNWAKGAYNRAKRAFGRIANKLKNARKALSRIKNVFKAGLKVFNHIRRHGLGGIINIRRLWFDVSLGSANLGNFAGGIDLQFFGRFNLKLRISFNLRRIASLAKSLFRKLVRRIKRIFG